MKWVKWLGIFNFVLHLSSTIGLLFTGRYEYALPAALFAIAWLCFAFAWHADET